MTGRAATAGGTRMFASFFPAYVVERPAEYVDDILPWRIHTVRLRRTGRAEAPIAAKGRDRS